LKLQWKESGQEGIKNSIFTLVLLSDSHSHAG
jgi:hypothetical protein